MLRHRSVFVGLKMSPWWCSRPGVCPQAALSHPSAPGHANTADTVSTHSMSSSSCHTICIPNRQSLPGADYKGTFSVVHQFCSASASFPVQNLSCRITRRAVDCPCFSHVPTLFPLCASLVWHWLLLSADIKGPLKRRGLGRQFHSGPANLLKTSCLL